MVNVEQVTPNNPNQTNLNKRSQEFKEKRLREAKERIKEVSTIVEPSILYKFTVGSILTSFLFVGIYLIVAFKLFTYIDFMFKLSFTTFLVGTIGYLITWLLIISRLFFNRRDFALLSLLFPPVMLLGVFSPNIRREAGAYLLFHFIFILFIISGLLLMCINQNLTLGQLNIFLQSQLDLKDSVVNKMLNSLKNFLNFFFGVDDPKYKK